MIIRIGTQRLGDNDDTLIRERRLPGRILDHPPADVVLGIEPNHQVDHGGGVSVRYMPTLTMVDMIGL